MVRYYGEEQRELIFKTVYTFDEENNIRERLRQRDFLNQQNMKVSTFKMNLETVDRNFNPEILDMIELIGMSRNRDKSVYKRKYYNNSKN